MSGDGNVEHYTCQHCTCAYSRWPSGYTHGLCVCQRVHDEADPHNYFNMKDRIAQLEAGNATLEGENEFLYNLVTKDTVRINKLFKQTKQLESALEEIEKFCDIWAANPAKWPNEMAKKALAEINKEGVDVDEH
jgi:hypothetical protein